MIARRLERARGLRTFVARFFSIALSRDESVGLLDLLDAGNFASRDIPLLIERLRVRH